MQTTLGNELTKIVFQEFQSIYEENPLYKKKM